MSDSGTPIPTETLEAIARSFFKETVAYGFRQVDYLRFVNLILDVSMKNGDRGGRGASGALPGAAAAKAGAAGPDARLGAAGAEVGHAAPLVGQDVEIRAFGAAGDRALFERWMTDSRGRYFLLSRTTARPLELDQLLQTDTNILGVITLGGAEPIGLMAFLDFDRAQRKAELRKLIGNARHRGKGYGKQATELWIRHGFADLGLKKIYLSTLETDVRNIRLNEELGFKVEGILRNECFFDNEYHDILRMALLAE